MCVTVYTYILDVDTVTEIVSVFKLNMLLIKPSLYLWPSYKFNIV